MCNSSHIPYVAYSFILFIYIPKVDAAAPVRGGGANGADALELDDDPNTSKISFASSISGFWVVLLLGLAYIIFKRKESIHV